MPLNPSVGDVEGQDEYQFPYLVGGRVAEVQKVILPDLVAVDDGRLELVGVGEEDGLAPEVERLRHGARVGHSPARSDSPSPLPDVVGARGQGYHRVRVSRQRQLRIASVAIYHRLA